jgi:subtilisin family serine protease
MLTVQYGGKTGKKLLLAESREHVVVRTSNRSTLDSAPLSKSARELISRFQSVVSFPRAGVEIYRTSVPKGALALRDKARAVLTKEGAVEFAGRVLVDKDSGEPVVYTENFFVKFADDESAAKCKSMLKKYKLVLRRPLAYARNAYFVSAPEGTGQEVFAIAAALLDEGSVELCHPELIREIRRRAVFSGQWHLKQMSVGGTSVNAHANVEAAWSLTRGEGSTVAVIDDGVDVDHEEFQSPGKVIHPRDVSYGLDSARPGTRDHHGTACAGVAVADGRFGASGVAPSARLLPIRFVSDLGSQEEADAFQWAADHGADVISCSWGPIDGPWWDPSHPDHRRVVPLPDSTRLAMEYAFTQGRNGRGCVITWAAGNGNESVDNDGYASHPKVIAVAACNDSGRKSAYSDFGAAVWCAFPSNDTVPAKTPGIFTTDRRGLQGYNPGRAELGDISGDYTNDFGGTSSACPCVAGVAALILARNPSLRHDEVKDILRRSCDRIDSANGRYDAGGHSAYYGYGRVNARKAVELASPAQPSPVTVVSTVRDVVIRDFGTATLKIAVAENRPLTGIKVRVEIDHTYIGDLLVRLSAPAAMSQGIITLHDRQGGGTDNLKKTYDTVSTPALLGLLGKKPAGEWKLTVKDTARLDTGTLRSVTLEMAF